MYLKVWQEFVWHMIEALQRTVHVRLVQLLKVLGVAVVVEILVEQILRRDVHHVRDPAPIKHSTIIDMAGMPDRLR